jgi:serine/threonine-protein kinase
MEPDAWAEVEALFAHIADLPVEQQARALAESIASPPVLEHVRELLYFDGHIDIDQWGQSVQRLVTRMELQRVSGRMLGPWRLSTPLGEGGMGRVFLAERCDGRFEALAAIKFVTHQAGRDMELFDRERRVLARLNHPGIARIIDAGEDQELGAYLVMEYVAGRPLDQVVKEDGLNVLQVVERMSEAALIVAHAHQSLVLHRDLKPDHLMVDEQNTLKILDFGVASLINQDPPTSSSGDVGHYTPRYAAPEQLANLSATTRTDVYALGLIMFELLSGGLSPFGAESDVVGTRKQLGQADPLPPLNGISRRQSHDLQAIVDCCLAADPKRRYAGPAELANDLNALSRDQAVSARTPSNTETIQRWIGHNRLAAAALGLAAITMVAGTGVSTWFAYKARLERDVAIIETAKAREVARFLEGVFQASTPGLESGPDVRARDLLKAGAARIDEELANQPDVAGALELAIARSYLSLGLYDEALSLVKPMRTGLHRQLQTDRRLVTARLELLAGRYAESIEILNPEWIQRLKGNTRAHASNLLATVLLNLGQSDEGERVAREALTYADNSQEGLELQLVTQGLLAAIAFNRQEYDQAIQVYSEIHSLHQRRHGPVHEETAQALHNLAGVFFMKGDLPAAISHYEEAIANKRAFYGVHNRSVAMSLRSLGLSYRRLGDTHSAEEALRKAMIGLKEWNSSSSAVYQEVAVQLMELFALVERERELVALLASLPDISTLDGVYAKDVHCRIIRLRQTYLKPEISSDICTHHRFSAASLQAFDSYLRAFSAKSRTADAAKKISTALDDANGLVPPDPLLMRAIQRLASEL